eukprot:bmy_07055T0
MMVLLRVPSASSPHICAAFVLGQRRIWNGLLAASGRLMGNEVQREREATGRPSELLDMADSETGETALHKAACQRNRAVCQLLVDAGASLRKTDSKGKTPQERAQQAGDPDLAAYLESRQNYKIIGHEDLETAV